MNTVPRHYMCFTNHCWQSHSVNMCTQILLLHPHNNNNPGSKHILIISSNQIYAMPLNTFFRHNGCMALWMAMSICQMVGSPLLSRLKYLKTIKWISMKFWYSCFLEGEPYWRLWSLDFSSSTNMSLTFLLLLKRFHNYMNRFPWNLGQKYCIWYQENEAYWLLWQS